jgi:hypothetical protein
VGQIRQVALNHSATLHLISAPIPATPYSQTLPARRGGHTVTILNDMKVYIQILLVLCSIDSLSQHNWDSKTWNKESLGFGCSVGGEMTKPVLNMTQLFMDKQFDEIKRLLNSDLPADQFLATFTLEKLQEKKVLEITDDELKRIKEIKDSDKMVPFCSGCTLWTEIPVKDLFDEKTKGIVSASADNWFDTYYKIYYKKRKNKHADN